MANSSYRRRSQILGVRLTTPMILINKPETQSRAIYIASYMAKEHTKGYGDRGTRDFSTSQLSMNSSRQDHLLRDFA